MRRLVVALFCLAGISAWAGDNDDYSIANISPALLKNANVIKRAEAFHFEITDKNIARLTRKVVYTILNEQGDQWSYFFAGYDKLRSLESFDGALYDASGKKIKNLKKSDIKDVSGTDDATLADDNRVKWHSFFYKGYPYTVEYEVEFRYKGTMFLPNWMPQEQSMMSVQKSSLFVVIPVDNPLRYKMFNYKGEPVITQQKNDKIYNWEIKDIAAVESEYASPSWSRITTSVYLATEKFSLGDYDGSNASWNDFGRFIYGLNKNRDVLPDDIKQKVHAMADGLPTVKEKIAKLYEFMQQNTHYISIQLGVGGWQPFEASFVAAKRYGDCKALSNYMFSLLKEAGIRSVYTLITSDNDADYLMVDLPCPQFNHAILFVPYGKDTTWLECTSQTIMPGYLGGSTGNRYALAIDENGGTLVRTPKYDANENLQLRAINATIDAEGNLSAIIKTQYKAVQQDRLHYFTNGLSKDKLMEFLKADIELPIYDIKRFDYKEGRNSLPTIDETLDLVADNYATVSGKRFFVTPNIISRSNRKLKVNEKRNNELVLDLEYRDIDSTEIAIPAGYTAESVPQDVKVENKFGKYKASVKLDGNRIIYYRMMEQGSGRFPASDYTELAKFYETVYKADRNKIVLVKTETAPKAF